MTKLEKFLNFLYERNLSKCERRDYCKDFLLANPQYTVTDFQKARNRHPFYRRIKKKGSYERNKARLELHNYSIRKKKRWEEKEVRFFLRKTDELRDFEIARLLLRSIAAIQSKRRVLHHLRKVNCPPRLFLENLMRGENQVKAITQF